MLTYRSESREINSFKRHNYGTTEPPDGIIPHTLWSRTRVRNVSPFMTSWRAATVGSWSTRSGQSKNIFHDYSASADTRAEK